MKKRPRPEDHAVRALWRQNVRDTSEQRTLCELAREIGRLMTLEPVDRWTEGAAASASPFLFAPAQGWGFRSMVGRVVAGRATEFRRGQALTQVASEHTS